MDGDRYHGFDALRASALLLGIALHAGMTFTAGFRGLGFPIVDVQQSTTVEILFFVIHVFRMALFYFVAGFFARMLFQRSGLGGFVKNRLMRVALPLVAFYPLIMPLTILPIVWAVRQVGVPAGAPPPGQGPFAQGIPWGHFWFLYLLLWCYALLVALRGAGQVLDRAGRVRMALDLLLRRLTQLRIAPLLLALPSAALLYLSQWWPQGAGIPAPIQGFIPNGPSLLAFGTAVLAGWWFHRQPGLLELLRRDWRLYLGAAAIATGVALSIIGVESNYHVVPMQPATRALYAGSYLLATWCWVFGLTGAVLNWRATPSPRWRYLADASYWMYLVHIPIIWALQAWMMRWPLHWTLKLTLILGISAVLLLGSYHYLVRATFIGKLLNGRKYPRSLPTTSRAPSTSPG